jgi:hypothetical protein
MLYDGENPVESVEHGQATSGVFRKNDIVLWLCTADLP